jgi:hypothetical protein
MLLRSESTLVGIRVLVERGLLLWYELRLGVCVASHTRGRLGRIGRSHGGTALCGRELLGFPAAEEEPDEGADQSESKNGANNGTGDPSLGTSASIVFGDIG